MSTLSFDTFANILNGVAVDSPTSHDVINPATKQKFATAPVATEKQLDEAVVHAAKAFKTWSKVSEDDRGAVVTKMGDLLEGRTSEFSALLTREQGKPGGEPSRGRLSAGLGADS